jgi:hypothetical protein
MALMVVAAALNVSLLLVMAMVVVAAALNDDSCPAAVAAALNAGKGRENAVMVEVATCREEQYALVAPQWEAGHPPLALTSEAAHYQRIGCRAVVSHIYWTDLETLLHPGELLLGMACQG